MIELDIDSKEYPSRLRNIPDPPSKLYVQGNVKLLNEISIAVVGSRAHSNYGAKMCKQFVKELVESNFVIVSGMAVGIDTIAHTTCLENGGKTIAVLPCGFKKIFPPENKTLYRDIIKAGGAVITEYEPNVKANSEQFLCRNRIVAGLAIGTLIIEAGYRSGTSVTARLTMEQHKKVFCVPSSVENRQGVTTNEIIKKGGYLVTSVADILEGLDVDELPKTVAKDVEAIERYKESKVSTEYMDVYKILSETPMHINDIVKRSGLSINEVNYKLMMLELEDAIVQISGNRFLRK